MRLAGSIVSHKEHDLGEVHMLKYINGGFQIELPGGEMSFIPEQDCTTAEKEVFDAYKAYYAALIVTIIGPIEINISGNGFDETVLLGGANTAFEVWLDAEGMKYSEIDPTTEDFPLKEGAYKVLISGQVENGAIQITGGELQNVDS
jgi:hypothetical protein